MNVFWSCRLRHAPALLLLIFTVAAVGTRPVRAGEFPAETGTEAVGPADPAGDRLDLGDALVRALGGSPRLAIFDQERRVRDALTLQASLRPSPEISFEVENFAGTGPVSGLGGAEYTLSLAQRIELGGKRSHRLAVAALEGELASWDYETVRLEVLSEVTRAFIGVISAQQGLAIADNLVEVAQQDLTAVDRRVTGGATSSIERTRARVALATARMDRESKRLDLTAAWASLVATWGGGPVEFGEAAGDLERIAPPPVLAHLVVRLESTPRIARWLAESSRRRARLDLERALGKIDLVAEGGLRRIAETGENAFVAALSVPLPFGDRNQGNVKAAELQLVRVENEKQAEVLAVSAALATHHAQLTAAYQSAQMLRDEIIPEARQAMATAENAYAKGLFTYTDVLAVRTTYFQLRSRYLESLTRYHGAVTDIERLVAGPLFEPTSASVVTDEQEQERP